MSYVLKGKGKLYTCTRCGGEYVAGNSLSKYCSADCRVKAGNNAQAARYRAEKAERPPIQCRWCGTEFTAQYGDTRKVFCSRSCKVRHEYKNKPGSTHRRRAKRFNCVYNSVDRLKVFNRDGWCCYICGVDTPISSMGTQKHDAPEQDHVIPLSQGGSHTYDNVKCSCRRCNQAKGVGERAAAIAGGQGKT